MLLSNFLVSTIPIKAYAVDRTRQLRPPACIALARYGSFMKAWTVMDDDSSNRVRRARAFSSGEGVSVHWKTVLWMLEDV